MRPSNLLRKMESQAPQPIPLTERAPPLFVTDRLGLHYGSQAALDAVTMTIPAGKITTLIGPSGCGKTSFLYCLSRLTDQLDDARLSGRILFKNEDLHDRALDIMALRRRMGIVFQKPTPFPFSIQKNIELPLREHGVRDKTQITAIIEQSLQDVGLWNEVKDRLHHSALSLSGGQQQRLCIARALALNPEVLLMDEPCSALDPISSGVVEDLIKDLGKQYTVIMVTHNLPQAKRVANDVAFFWMRNGAGQLIEHGPAEEIFRDPKDPLTAEYVTGAKG